MAAYRVSVKVNDRFQPVGVDPKHAGSLTVWSPEPAGGLKFADRESATRFWDHVVESGVLGTGFPDSRVEEV